MQLECPNCQNDLAVPDRLRRYYDMPVRCHQCRHVFTVKRQTLYDAAGPSHDVRQPLDRSVSARQSHHMIACRGCDADLRVPAQDQVWGESTAGPLTLTCPYCLASFRHPGTGDTARLDRLITSLVAAILTGCGILWGQHEGFIELRNLGDGTLLAVLRQTLADLVIQLRTAAMARLV